MKELEQETNLNEEKRDLSLGTKLDKMSSLERRRRKHDTVVVVGHNSDGIAVEMRKSFETNPSVNMNDWIEEGKKGRREEEEEKERERNL